VVVDDVEDHGQPARVRGVDEALQRGGAAVGVMRRGDVDAVVAPAALARSLGHRHQLDRVDAESCEARELLDRSVERARRRERAHVQLVDHELRARWRAESPVRPCVRRGVEHARGFAQPARLVARTRIGPASRAGATDRRELDRIIIIRRDGCAALPDVEARVAQRRGAARVANRDRRRARGPYAELAVAVVERAGAEWRFPGVRHSLGCSRAGVSHRTASGGSVSGAE
jgi:hypothetical protein